MWVIGINISLSENILLYQISQKFIFSLIKKLNTWIGHQSSERIMQ